VFCFLRVAIRVSASALFDADEQRDEVGGPHQHQQLASSARLIDASVVNSNG
jgi:hypothetical protein